MTKLSFKCRRHPQIFAIVAEYDDRDDSGVTWPKGRPHPKVGDDGNVFLYTECAQCGRPWVSTEAAVLERLKSARRAGVARLSVLF